MLFGKRMTPIIRASGPANTESICLDKEVSTPGEASVRTCPPNTESIYLDKEVSTPGEADNNLLIADPQKWFKYINPWHVRNVTVQPVGNYLAVLKEQFEIVYRRK